MSKINYQELREIAKKATQGEWSAFISPGTGTYAVHTPGDKRCEDVIKWTGFDGQKNAENNARYIAAFNPEVVQALLDERERNQQYIKSRDQENENIALTVGRLRVELEAAKKRIAELEAEPVSQTYKLPPLSSNEVNDAAWKLHNMLTEHGPLNGRQFNNLKGCFYEALKVAMRNYPVTPDGWVIVPKKLTAENGAKGVLSGEFSETTFISCPECFGDDDCDTCDGSGRIEIKVPVTWTTIKSIWDKGIAYFAAEPRQEVNRG
ncbi:ead/Ea22-like family protein [Escherichia coli]|uniref:ead/Ea22-like family protein n=1 Tax=Escherichia coli TaxID=562 RepID=UPI001B1665F6|nr:ead/Ea22-like family protein [Escherichia coli]HBA7035816.1 ead/Ea22-like family protein [Escherichia coli]